jgi:hypothetical protein
MFADLNVETDGDDDVLDEVVAVIETFLNEQFALRIEEFDA